MVTRISNRLAKDIFGTELTDSGLLQIMEYASLHDTPELLMGDLPSPLKRHIEKLSGNANPVEAIEREIAPWLFEMKEAMKEAHPEYLVVVKLADIIDALVFIIDEGIGGHAKQVTQRLYGMLEDKLKEAISEFPQYNWRRAIDVLNELLQNAEKTKVAFE